MGTCELTLDLARQVTALLRQQRQSQSSVGCSRYGLPRIARFLARDDDAFAARQRRGHAMHRRRLG
jgi:hypothetical protein